MNAGRVARALPAALLVLAGCMATTPKQEGAASTSSNATSTGNAGSTPAADPSRSSGASGARPTTTGRETGQADTLGNRAGAKPLASFEGDLVCSRLVAPFDLSDNAAILSELGLQGGLTMVGAAFEQWARGSTAKVATQQATATHKHNISYELRTTAVRMNWLPMQAERAYGRAVLAAMDKAGKIEPDDSEQGRQLYPLARTLLDKTLKGVDERHDYAFEVHVSTDSGQNALALPGGVIVVDPALLRDARLSRKAQFAMAHEVGHVLQRHETRALQARIIDAVSLRGSLSDLAKVMGNAKNEPAAIAGLLLAGKLQFERHYTVQELHSDGCAVRILEKSLANDGQLVAVLNGFIAGLPPATREPPNPLAQRAAGAAGAGANVRTAVNSTNAAAGSADAQKAQKALEDVQNLVNLVTRPIDRHPTTDERVTNLRRTLTFIDRRRQEAARAARAAGTATTTTNRPAATTAPVRAPAGVAQPATQPPARPPVRN